MTPVLEATATRLDRVRQLLSAHDLDLLVVTPGSDMAYLIGYFGEASERPVLLLIGKEARSQIVMARFESRALPDLGEEVGVVPYDETDDVFALTREVVDLPAASAHIAISDRAWARVVLRLEAALPVADFVYASPYLRQLRMIKDQGELDYLGSAGERTDRALEGFLGKKLSGRSERELATDLRRRLEDEGLDAPGAIVGSGPNGASPHHHPSDRVVREGDMVVLDCGGTFHGYYSDITRTVSVGNPSEDAVTAYRAVQHAHQTAVEAVRPGVSAESIDRAARSIIEDAGLGDAFIHRTGHGVGLDGHEEPYIVDGNDLQVEPGMVFSVEPGVYLEGRFGIRIEDVVAVTTDGVESFNHLTHDLQIVG